MDDKPPARALRHARYVTAYFAKPPYPFDHPPSWQDLSTKTIADYWIHRNDLFLLSPYGLSIVVILIYGLYGSETMKLYYGLAAIGLASVPLVLMKAAEPIAGRFGIQGHIMKFPMGLDELSQNLISVLRDEGVHFTAHHMEKGTPKLAGTFVLDVGSGEGTRLITMWQEGLHTYVHVQARDGDEAFFESMKQSLDRALSYDDPLIGRAAD